MPSSGHNSEQVISEILCLPSLHTTTPIFDRLVPAPKSQSLHIMQGIKLTTVSRGSTTVTHLLEEDK